MEEPGIAIADQISDAGTPLWVLHRGQHPAGLVHGEVLQPLPRRHRDPVEGDCVPTRIPPDALLAHHRAVDGHPACRNQFFAGTTAAQTGGSQDTLKADTSLTL